MNDLTLRWPSTATAKPWKPKVLHELVPVRIKFLGADRMQLVYSRPEASEKVQLRSEEKAQVAQAERPGPSARRERIPRLDTKGDRFGPRHALRVELEHEEESSWKVKESHSARNYTFLEDCDDNKECWDECTTDCMGHLHEWAGAVPGIRLAQHNALAGRVLEGRMH